MNNVRAFERLPAALSREEEQSLLQGDKNSLPIRDRLLMCSLRDAMKYASTVSEGKIEYSELMSLCTLALLRAIHNYDPSHKAKLSLMQFAKPFIRGEVKRYWKRLNVISYGSRLPEDTSTELLENVIDYETVDPDFEKIHANERWQWVLPHHEKLSETERRVLTFIFYSRFSLADIGRMLDCTRENVRVTKNRALMKIRKGLYRDRKWFAS
jgi:RNA polymerase sigma factor (sigma-70 family)